MNTKYLLPALGLAALPFLQSSKPAADSLRFAPAADATVTMEFANSLEFFLEDFSLEAMGQDMSEMMGDVEATLNADIEVEFTDEYTSTEDGRPLSFARTYGEGAINGELTGSGGGESDTTAFELNDGMDGHTVLFSWDSEEDEYTKAYPEDVEGDEDLLAGLSGRADLAFMLPTGEVEVDEEWTIDPTMLAELLVPGGDLNYDTPDGDRDRSMETSGDEMDEEMLNTLRDLMSGEVTGTYKGLNDDGMAVIEVEMDLAGDKNLADMIMSAMEQFASASGEDINPDEMPSFDDFTVDFTLEGSGTLIWDAKAGLAVSFTMSAETEVAVSVAMTMEPQPGMVMDMTSQVSFGGSADISMDVSR